MPETNVKLRRFYDLDGIVDKNCPFCNGSPQLKVAYNEKQDMTYILVRCTVCGAQGRAYNHLGYVENITDAQEKVDLTVKAWDTRPRCTKRT